MEVVTISNIADGAVPETFDDRLTEVLKNIVDPNTDPKATRKIILEFHFRTNEEREVGAVQIKSKTVLAGQKPIGTTVFMGRHEGQLVAVEHNPKQTSLFDEKGANVVQMNGGK